MTPTRLEMDRSGGLRFCDSHCHLQDEAFADELPAVLERAHAAGVTEIVVIGEDPEAAEWARRLSTRSRVEADSGRSPAIWYTSGVHPHIARSWGRESRERVEGHLLGEAVAVGETGLDYHYDNSPRADQRRAFADQLALAVQHDAPVVIHSREAEDDTLSILADSRIEPERVVLHCFSGSREMLEEGVSRGYWVSFSGMVTFKKFPAEELVPRVPLERLMAETDAPYLAPVPHRGRRNEPAFVVETVRGLADLHGTSPDSMARATRENALRFYRIL